MRKSFLASGVLFLSLIGAAPKEKPEDIDSLISTVQGADQSKAIAAIHRLGELKAKKSAPLLFVIKDHKTIPAGARTAAATAIKAMSPFSQAEQEWIEHAHDFVRLDGKYIRLPDFDLRFPSSLRMTFDAAKAELSKHPDISTYTKTDALGHRVTYSEKIPPKPEEIWDYLQALPNYKTGSFGEARGLQISQVVNRNDAIIETGDAHTPTIFLRGINTTGWVDGWLVSTEGKKDGRLDIAIIGTTTYGTTVGSNTVPLAVPLPLVYRGVTFEQYQQARANP